MAASGISAQMGYSMTWLTGLTHFVETNLAQMLAHSVYEGVANGWLPANYRPHADRMRDAARGKMDDYGFVRGACSAPDFNKPGTSTEAQAFCILMEAASLGVSRLDGSR
jgi:unsaturated rhamnogalacturonyl hydrolase